MFSTDVIIFVYVFEELKICIKFYSVIELEGSERGNHGQSSKCRTFLQKCAPINGQKVVYTIMPIPMVTLDLLALSIYIFRSIKYIHIF